MIQLDRSGQRIAGVLIEKQLSVPDSYPLTENALVAGCNQTSNRDPVMDLKPFQVAGALLQLHEAGVVARVEGLGRVPKFRHRLDERLGIGKQELAVLAELLLRGPQAPGALKPRVARMGFAGGQDEVEAVLRRLGEQAIAEQLPLGPRERDRRWRHLLGDAGELPAPAGDDRSAHRAEPPPEPSAPLADPAELLRRIAALERRVAALEEAAGLAAEDESIAD